MMTIHGAHRIPRLNTETAMESQNPDNRYFCNFPLYLVSRP